MFYTLSSVFVIFAKYLQFFMSQSIHLLLRITIFFLLSDIIKYFRCLMKCLKDIQILRNNMC